MRFLPATAAAAGLLVLAVNAQASIRQFSYDPADADTRAAAGGVTVVVNQGMFGVRVLKLRATEAKATADLGRAEPGALGHGGLVGALGAAAPERDLYAVLPAEDGPALVAALCPGSKRAWLAMTAVRFGADLQAVAIGDDPKGGPARRCRTLDFTFHGEWRAPMKPAQGFDPIGPPDFPN